MDKQQAGTTRQAASPRDPNRLAGQLRDAQSTATRLRAPRSSLDVDSAYDIQSRGRSLRTAGGDEVIGHKVGLTSGPSRHAFAVDQPVSGYLLASTVAGESEASSLARLLSPRVEVEIAFILGTPVYGDVTPEDVLTATSELALALEIVDSRWEGGAPSAGWLVADNVSASGVVLGERITPADVDLRTVTVAVTVGDSTAQGDAHNVFEHPARSVAWLAAHLARRGERLHAGEVVLSGTLTPPIAVGPGDQLMADFGSLGRIATTFGD